VKASQASTTNVRLSWSLKLMAFLRFRFFELLARAQSLREPKVRPRTRCFCTIRMKMKLGMIADVPSAVM
jgi:hypothetical protein